MGFTVRSPRLVATLAFRWVIGLALISWRYLWQTTPLYRSFLDVDEPRAQSVLPDGVDTDGLQHIGDGVGSMFHRLFRIQIVDAQLDAKALMGEIMNDLGGHVPREVVHLRSHGAAHENLKLNSDFVVDMPGPWNGPVRVIAIGETHLRLATRAGHLEAGQIEFRAYDNDGGVVFEIEALARPSSPLVHLLYARMRLAMEIQLNMWVRFCKAALRTSGGRASRGISITTYRAPEPTAADAGQ